jgi:hypothetical protein
MMAAHHAGADHTNAQRLVHVRSARIISRSQHARNSLSIMLLVSALIRAISAFNIKY